MSQSTRDDFIASARTLFAAKGYDGVSIAEIAKCLGLTKQALLHHFSSKAKLYGEVLAQISGEFTTEFKTDLCGTQDPRQRLILVLQSLQTHALADDVRTRLLMRELLDNPGRADKAEKWYLRPFLDDLTEMLIAVPGWETRPVAEARAVLYQILGAINYYAVSQATLRNLYGADDFAALNRAYPAILNHVLERTL